MSTTDLLSMDEAIARLGITRSTCYRWLREGRIRGLKAGRQWRFRPADLASFLSGNDTVSVADDHFAALAASVRATLPEHYEPAETMEQLVGQMLVAARLEGATDLHGEPQADGTASIRLRVDGVLHERWQLPGDCYAALVTCWMTLTGCSQRDRELPQDGRMRMRHDDHRLDVRVCFLPSLHGDLITARLINPEGGLVDLDTIGFMPNHRELVDTALAAPAGLTLVVGPTGSGKSTTLYALVQELIDPAEKVVAVEDPVEFAIPGVCQVGIKPQVGLSFAGAIRAALRSDPDTLVVAEIRDPEVADLCLKAAITGHRVVATMHAADAVAGLERLKEFGCPDYLLNDGLNLLIGQRLLRKVCHNCGGAGCHTCRDRGYRGRLALHQVLVPDHAVIAGDALAACKDLRSEGQRRVDAGQTTMAEVERVVG